MENAISLVGFVLFALLAWVLSENRGRVNWRPVLAGAAMQFVLGALVFLFPPSRGLFLKFSEAFTCMVESSRWGIDFVFGSLARQRSPSEFILAFQALPFIVIFGSLMALLFYWRLIPWIAKGFARLVSKSLSVSGAESLCASVNIFAGVESATAIKPYIDGMTRSELFIILTASMSTAASSVMALYVSFLSDTFPAIAGHLMSASILSVPASFVIGKLMVPETGQPLTMDASKCELHSDGDPKSSTEAVMNGAMNGARIAAGVAVSLIAFIGLLGMLRMGFGKLTGDPVFIERTLSYIFIPFTWLMGVQPQDVQTVSMMLGKRLILTEIPSYLDLAAFGRAGGSPRSMLIASYALCGFTHVASVAITVGGISALAPSKSSTLARLGPRALVASTLVTLMTGAVAGIFYWGQGGIIQ